ncbi:MAG: sigma-70 family RNA polymerase sigma factor [Candidatus Nomurabacteria bacterium]|nr:MAG: sigma-70 family RNA polymerase sigma factor [Candidatus Nomurabacteria bacterium]
MHLNKSQQKEVQKFLQMVGAKKPLTLEEEKRLFEKSLSKDQIKKLLISHNARYIVHVVKEHLYEGVEIADLLQEGLVATYVAADKFDHTRGFKFISYATHYMKAYILKFCSEEINFSLSEMLKHIKVKKISSIFEQKFGIYPLIQDIAFDEEVMEYLGISSGNLKKIFYKIEVLSLEATYKERRDGESYTSSVSPIDVLIDETFAIDPEMEKESFRMDLKEFFKILNIRLRTDLSFLIFNIGSQELIKDSKDNLVQELMEEYPSGYEVDLETLGLVLGISKERVRQRIHKSISELRKREKLVSLFFEKHRSLLN